MQAIAAMILDLTTGGTGELNPSKTHNAKVISYIDAADNFEHYSQREKGEHEGTDTARCGDG